eukprot:753839-Hanusia_phi.AAC.1
MPEAELRTGVTTRRPPPGPGPDRRRSGSDVIWQKAAPKHQARRDKRGGDHGGERRREREEGRHARQR